jgi:orotate phosphoribosyltransferase
MTQKMSNREALGKEIVEGLRSERMILTWTKDRPEGWTLASGMWSPFYINLRLITSAPALYKKVGEAMSMLVEEAGFKADGAQKLVGIAMAGIPFANAITLQTGIPSLYTRKLPQDVVSEEQIKAYIASHGQHALVEGDLKSGDKLAIVDDLVTKFSGKQMAIAQIMSEAGRRGFKVDITDVIVLLDREQGAAEKAREQGVGLHSVIPFASKGIDWLRDSFTPREYNVIKSYLIDPQTYQDKSVQQDLLQLARVEN